jgi:hypothetical protein
LNSPSNNAWYKSPLDFTCSATHPTGLSIAYLWVNGTFIPPAVAKPITGTSNTTTFSSKTLADGTYLWNCLIYDNTPSPLGGWASSNYTINIDSTNPSVTLTSPTDGMINSTSTQTLEADITDNMALKNYTLLIYNNSGYTIGGGMERTISGGLHVSTQVIFSDGIYNWTYQGCDYAGNCYTTSNRTITIETASPTINIVYPVDTNSYALTTISINYTATPNILTPLNCWYNIYNSTGSLIVANTTLPNCINTTFTAPRDDTYTLHMFVNDSLNLIGSAISSFTLSTGAPAISLSNPINNKALNTNLNLRFNFTAVTGTAISQCQLWGNWTGAWSKNQTLTSVTSGVETNFNLVNISDGAYIWNVWCNDTVNNAAWASTNKTFIVDTIFPSVVQGIYSPTTIYPLAQSVTAFGTISDINLNSVWIMINLTGSYQNITAHHLTGNTYYYGIASSSITNFRNISWYWYANDSAGNTNVSALKSFIPTDRNPYNITITSQNNSLTNQNWTIINFTGSDPDLDVLNYTLYNSSDGITFSKFNSTTNGWINFTGFNNTQGAVTYFYINASDSQLSNISSTYQIRVDTQAPQIVTMYPPMAGPGDNLPAVCSPVNIPLSYSVTDNVNLSYCSFEATQGTTETVPLTIIGDCSNVTFSLDTIVVGVNQLHFSVYDLAGNVNTSTYRFYYNPVAQGCGSPPTPGGGGIDTTPINTTKLLAGICGNKLCEADVGETFLTCPTDCPGNLEPITTCFSEDVQVREKSCLFYQSTGILYIIGFIVLVIIFVLFFGKKKKGNTTNVAFMPAPVRYRSRR